MKEHKTRGLGKWCWGEENSCLVGRGGLGGSRVLWGGGEGYFPYAHLSSGGASKSLQNWENGVRENREGLHPRSFKE